MTTPSTRRINPYGSQFNGSLCGSTRYA
ncbi:hypothetical protein OF001_U190034 [Pseudomonas sp. OF001]|nr:hypothetical protein OF001_U190034 [Pseudomonas sp. OF001]